jgi:hypothetical protein
MFVDRAHTVEVTYFLKIVNLSKHIFSALSQNGALTSGEVIETIKVNWNESINPENVRPTLWRLVQAGRLKKRGDRYDLP